jgi:hypothetical protein
MDQMHGFTSDLSALGIAGGISLFSEATRAPAWSQDNWQSFGYWGESEAFSPILPLNKL